MKKIAALYFLLSGFTLAMGQNNLSKVPTAVPVELLTTLDGTIPTAKQTGTLPTGSNAKKLPAVIWSENFSGGIPSGWTNTGVSDADAVWVYRGTATTPTISVGGQGDCSGGVPINSPTKSNGFIIFDSNDMDPVENCTPANPNTGNAAPPQEGTLQTSSINLSAYPNVVLKFYYFGRNYMGTPTVNVSGDGGSTWSQMWTWSLTTNQASVNPELVEYNISAIAGGKSDVKLEFKWEGYYYELMIDDISIEEAPGNDLKMVDAGYLDPFQTPYYYKIPIHHAGDMTMEGWMANMGKNSQINTKLVVNVNSGLFNDTIPGGTIASLDTAYFVDSIKTFTPQATGIYTFTFKAISDSTDFSPANNTLTKTQIISDTIFSRDNDVAVYQFKASSFGLTGPYEFGNWFEPVKGDTATSMSFEIGGKTVIGTIVQGNIYDADNFPTMTLVGQTNFYSISASDIGTSPNYKTVTLKFDPPVTLTAKKNYIVSIADFSGTDTAMTVLTTSDLLGGSTGFFFGSNQWYTLSYLPFVRMNVTTPPPPCTVAAAVSATKDTCNGGYGSATVAATGGTVPFTYLWNNATSASVASGLSTGTYSVLVTDSTGCTTNAVATVTNVNTNLTVSGTATTADTCNYGLGTASVTTTGGIAPLSYLWSPGGKTTSAVTSLIAGAYSVTVTDKYSCTANSSTSVANYLTNIADSVTGIDESGCGVGDGSATVYPYGGIGGYDYSWSTGDTTANVDSLTAGIYNVTISDSYGCSVSDNVNIGSVGAPSVTVTNVTDVACFSGSNGTATATASGGTGPLTYSWSTSPSQDSTTATGLTAGNYTVMVTDSTGCFYVAQVTITQPAAALSVLDSSVDASCSTVNNGVACILASGGTPSYFYIWNTIPLQTVQCAIGLASNNYSCTITDSKGCSITDGVTVNAGAGIALAQSTVPVSCFGGSNGTGTITALGGTSPYSYLWNDPAPLQSTQTATGLTSGTWTVTVNDNKGCSATASVTITEPGALAITEVITPYVSTTNKGSITLTVSGGASPYTYLWSPNVGTGSLVNGLMSGDYSVTITDSKGCTKTGGPYLVPTGINEVGFNAEINIIPNPNSGKFRLTMNGVKKDTYTLEVRNIIGQIISTEILNLTGNFTKEYNLSKFNKGVYLMNVKNSKGESTKKIVIY